MYMIRIVGAIVRKMIRVDVGGYNKGAGCLFTLMALAKKIIV